MADNRKAVAYIIPDMLTLLVAAGDFPDGAVVIRRRDLSPNKITLGGFFALTCALHGGEAKFRFASLLRANADTAEIVLYPTADALCLSMRDIGDPTCYCGVPIRNHKGKPHG